MRRARPLALCISLGIVLSGPVFARDPDDVPWEGADQKSQHNPATIEDILRRDLGTAPDGADGAIGSRPDQPDLYPNHDTRRSAIDDDRLEPPPPVEAKPAPHIPLPELAREPAPAAQALKEPDRPVTSPPPAAQVTAPPAHSPRQFEPTAGAPPATQALKAPEHPASPAPPPATHQVTPSAPAAATPPAAAGPPVPAAAPSAPAATATPTYDPNKLYLPVKRYFDTKAVVTLKDFDQGDKEALLRFYEARFGEPLWTAKDGLNASAQNLISELKKADDWGLSASDYKIPALTKPGTAELSEDELADAEIKLSLAAMQYGREARGDRIDEPSTQLSSYIDRKPQLIERSKYLDAIATVADKGEYLRSLHPKHPQFERLRQKLLALRSDTAEEDFEKIPDGPKITPGKSHWQVALVRRRLKVALPGMKPDGTAADENYYDDALAGAVERFKEEYEIVPVNTTITSALRTALNKNDKADERALLANMEQWRWMPADLGSTHIYVNIPEFMVRVVKNDTVIHAERIVTGKFETQTPIFSDMMRTVVFQPSWNVPESIKILELLPKLRAGNNPIEGQGLAIKRNGHDVDVWDVDWEKQDIRNFHIYQPPGETNVLGVVKFLFPNKHSVYLHDTPSKRLFNEKVRMFSHGCMRVRNPVQLAEVIMAEDKGWDKQKINDLAYEGPPDNDVALDHPIPVHVTYFTAWVEDNGELKTFADVYGHEQRVKLGLEGRWGEIVKNRDHLLPPEDAPVARSRDDWGDEDSAPPPPKRQRAQRYTYREEAPVQRAPQPTTQYKKKSSFSQFMNSIFGN